MGLGRNNCESILMLKLVLNAVILQIGVFGIRDNQ